MTHSKKDAWVWASLAAAFAITMLWGYFSGDFQKLLQHKTPEQKAAALQRAIDHKFGVDREFDPSADNITITAETAQDSVSWKILSHATFHVNKSNSASPAKVDFGADVQKIDGHEVTITGYMFPLQESFGQAHFLLSAYPPSCPYCLPGGPTELIEVIESDPLKFTYQAITIHGTFHVLRDSALIEGMFYRMTNVKLQKTS